MNAYVLAAFAVAALLIGGAVHRLRRATRQVDTALRETADDTTPEDAAAEAVGRGFDRLFTALGPPPEPEPTLADRTPLGDDDWTRAMDRHTRRTAKRRNTGPRRRLP